MTRGQISRTADRRQDAVEAQLAELGTSLARLEHDELRVRQAIERRAGLSELLDPVLADLARVADSIRAAQSRLRAEWELGQENRWEP